MSVGKRMRQARKSLDKTQIELAKELGISRPLLSIIEIDKQRPNSDIIAAMQEKYGISASWLLTGEGEMRRTVSDEIRITAQSKGLDADKLLVLNEFLRLSETERDAVIAFAERLNQALKDKGEKK